MASTALIARDDGMGADTRAHAAGSFRSGRIGTTVLVAVACGISTASRAFVGLTISDWLGTGRQRDGRERQ